MDPVETMLARELAETAAGPSFPMSEMLAGVNRRRRRRAAVLTVTAAAATALVAVGAGTVVTAARQHPARTAQTGASDSAEPSSVRWMTGPMPTAVQPIGGAFADSTHGYLVAIRCVATDRTCRAELEVTADGGHTWTRRALPVQPPYALAQQAQVHVLAPGTLVYDRASTALDFDHPKLETRHRRFLSTDAGSSWREIAAGPVDATDAVPNGCAIYPGWADDNSYNNVTTVCPDGRAAYLPIVMRFGLTEATTSLAGDALFVYGRTSAAPQDVDSLWTSSDRGHSWQPLTPPISAPANEPDVWTAGTLLAQSRNTLYYLAERAPAAGAKQSPLPTVYRSVDGGSSWNPVPLPNVGQVADADRFWAVASQGLLITLHGRLFQLDPQASTFREIAGAPVGRRLTQVGTAVLGTGVTDPTNHSTDVFSLSFDGTTWSPLNLP